jgi:hypothetical protein
MTGVNLVLHKSLGRRLAWLGDELRIKVVQVEITYEVLLNVIHTILPDVAKCALSRVTAWIVI